MRIAMQDINNGIVETTMWTTIQGIQITTRLTVEGMDRGGNGYNQADSRGGGRQNQTDNHGGGRDGHADNHGRD